MTFDFWFTLASSPPDLAAWWREERLGRLAALLEEHGHPGKRPAVDAYWRDGRTGVFRETRGRGLVDVPSEVHVDAFFDWVGVPAGRSSPLYRGAHAILTRVLLERPPPLAPRAAAVLSELHSEGVKLGVVSNTGVTPGSTLREVLSGWGILEYFEPRGLVFSDEVLLVKPNPDIFKAAARGLGVRADELVHVGDNPTDDVLGVQALGGRGVLYRGLYGVLDPAAVARYEADLLTIEPDAVIDDHVELLGALTRLLPGSATFKSRKRER
ncbi:MAG: HAD family hydrolase [Promethearchaeota archaeon]